MKRLFCAAPLAGLLATVVAIAWSPAVAAGGDVPHGLLVAKKPGGPYSDFLSLSIHEGKSKTVYWRVINPDTPDLEMKLDDDGTATDGSYKYSWFRGTKAKPSKNITSQVGGTAAGYDFTVAAGDTKAFSTVIKATGSEGDCMVGNTMSSTSGNARSVAVSLNDGVC